MKKVFIVVLLGTLCAMLSSCGCETPECIKARADAEIALKAQREEQMKAAHERELERLKNTPVEVQAAREARRGSSSNDGLKNAAAIYGV